MNPYSQIAETSAAQGLAACNKCGLCCERSPCLLLPEDAPRMARAMGMTVRAFAKHLRVEHTPDDRWQVRMRPRCVFLIGKQCTAQEFKPTGGREFECWTPATFAASYFWEPRDLRILGFSPPIAMPVT